MTAEQVREATPTSLHAVSTNPDEGVIGAAVTSRIGRGLDRHDVLEQRQLPGDVSRELERRQHEHKMTLARYDQQEAQYRRTDRRDAFDFAIYRVSSICGLLAPLGIAVGHSLDSVYMQAGAVGVGASSVVVHAVRFFARSWRRVNDP